MKALSLTAITILFCSLALSGQEPIIIDHNCTGLQEIPANWIDSAKNELHIAYGHTSHGSQLTSGMNAIESFFDNGQYDWSHSGGEGELHLFEGDGYGDGYMDHDIGYSGWADETREYLNLFPETNVIIWSWCGQVNNVNLPSHLFTPMEALESEYPNVKFVYMTGHLEGQGPEGSLYTANQQIRDYCATNNKILYDFADIEKYDPDGETNYQQYYADDACNYTHPENGSSNWADDWINANPEHDLAQISALCSSCAHSMCLNCVQKGIAAWHLWARLAGWKESEQTGIEYSTKSTSLSYPNPTNGIVYLSVAEEICEIKVLDLQGRLICDILVDEGQQEINLYELPVGAYIMQTNTISGGSLHEVFIKK